MTRLDNESLRAAAIQALGAAEMSLVSSVKAAERATIEAALTGSRSAAVKALAIHPLVDSVYSAQRILNRELSDLPELRAVLADD